MKRPGARALPSNNGFTLVELLIASVIGLIVIGIATTIFAQSYKTSRRTTALGHIQENGRLVDAILGRDLRQAGSFGCTEMDDTRTTVNDLPSDVTFTKKSSNDDFINGDNGGDFNNSDAITLREASGASGRVDSAGTGAITLENDIGDSMPDLAPDDLAVITDCTNAGGSNDASDVFEVASADSSSTDITPTSNLSHGYGDGSTVFAVRQIGYQVVKNDDDVPTLQRKVNGGDWQDVIEHVYGMKIVYGEDTDSDHVANRYVSADQVGDFANVVALRAQLLIGSDVINVVKNADNTDSNGNQELEFGDAFGGAPRSLPDGRIGRRFTIAAAVHARMP